MIVPDSPQVKQEQPKYENRVAEAKEYLFYSVSFFNLPETESNAE